MKVQADVTNRDELKEICSIYKAKIIDLSPDSMVFELTGEPEKIDAFLKMLAGYKILEMAAPASPPWAGRRSRPRAAAVSLCFSPASGALFSAWQEKINSRGAHRGAFPSS